jgi:hypothetical protein
VEIVLNQSCPSLLPKWLLLYSRRRYRIALTLFRHQGTSRGIRQWVSLFGLSDIRDSFVGLLQWFARSGEALVLFIYLFIYFESLVLETPGTDS